jgi:probable F420-dependent oxidoreductase
MRFGLALPFVQQMPGEPAWARRDDIASLVAVAQRADALGYGWLPCSDHVLVPQRAVPSMGATWYEPATTLAFLAGVTTTIRLLSHVLILPYHSPFDVAKQYATLDRLSGGRVVLGAGAGHLRSEFRALGVDFDPRGDVTNERLRVIKTLWENEEASFDGVYHRFEAVRLAPRPLQQPRPPIWVGGNSRRAIRRAVELGDGWVPFEVTLDDVRDRLAYARRLPAYERRQQPLDVIVPAAIDLRAQAIDGDRAPFAGSASQVIEDIASWREAGVMGMTAGFRAGSLEEQVEKMEAFAREVMAAD